MTSWKQLERKTAKELNGQRMPNDGTGGVDVMHDRFAIECKYRAKLAFKKWYGQAVGYAKGTDKIPLLVCKEKNQQGEFVILKMNDFKTLIEEDVN